MAFFDADLSVNNSKLNELEFLVENNVNVYKKKDLLYSEKDNKVLEVGGVLKEKNDGTISGKVISLAVKDTENDDPVWDLSNFSFDANKLAPRCLGRKASKRSAKSCSRARTLSGDRISTTNCLASMATTRSRAGAATTGSTAARARTSSRDSRKRRDPQAGRHLRLRPEADQQRRHDRQVQREGRPVELKQKIFTDLKKGELHEDYFTVGKKAEGDNPQIIYRPDKGHLLYDADGAGGKDP